MSLFYVCGDCGYRPVGRGRPSVNSCPQCRGDFTWEPSVVEKVAQQLRAYMSDTEAEAASVAVLSTLADTEDGGRVQVTP